MDSMNKHHYCLISWQKIASKTLIYIHKVLLVVSIYLIFGLLLQQVRATPVEIEQYNECHETVGLCSSDHDSAWEPSNNDEYIDITTASDSCKKRHHRKPAWIIVKTALFNIFTVENH